MHKAVLPPVLSLALAATTLLAVSACGDDEDPVLSAPTTAPTTAAPTAAPTTAAPTTAPATATPTTAAPTSSVKQFRITVKGGKATGDTGLLQVAKDEPFQVIVTSDVADEVHVHSETRAGFPEDVEAGGTVTVDAVIKAPGKYEVELEDSKFALAQIEVR